MPEPEVVYVRLHKAHKAEVAEAAEEAGMTLNAWAANVLVNAARGRGLPPPPAGTPLPDAGTVLSSWATGQRLLGPCGRNWPCDATDGLEEVNGVQYCRCGVRVS